VSLGADTPEQVVDQRLGVHSALGAISAREGARDDETVAP
jgi:hypothetical protein